ncbi:MAG: flagellar basal body protein [Endozoicomonas sp.]
MNAASLSLIVTSNNIANASVPGYSRQQAMFTTTPTGSEHVSEVRFRPD